jgi:hypothetical protein
MFTYIDLEDHVWIGQNKHVRKKDLTLQDLDLGLNKVADEKAFPRNT